MALSFFRSQIRYARGAASAVRAVSFCGEFVVRCVAVVVKCVALFGRSRWPALVSRLRRPLPLPRGVFWT
jgi:hypothetical protein